MRGSRRSFLKATALGAGAAIAAPYMFVRTIDQAWGAQSWLKKGEPIKIGLLFSLTGGLAVPEEDSTLVMQYAIDEINKFPRNDAGLKAMRHGVYRIQRQATE